MSEERFTNAYKENIKTLGVDNPRSLLVPDWDRLREVYYELLQHVVFDGKTLLDIGCGYGGFVEFLYKVAHQKLSYYFGVDMLDEAVDVANERLAKIDGVCDRKIEVKNVLSTDFDDKLTPDGKNYDIAIALEVMSTMSDANYLLEPLFALETEWVVFTCLSPYTYHGRLNAYAPETILSYCLLHTPHVRLIHEREGSYMIIARRTA